MKYLYKYPQQAYPYDNLVATSKRRSRHEWEYELMDTGIFNGSRYFDIFVEYVKESPEDILIKITAFNRGPEAAPLHILPTLWFRNTWSWTTDAVKPMLKQVTGDKGSSIVETSHQELGANYLYCKNAPTLLFTENETNTARLFGMPNRTRYVKDSINNYVVEGMKDAVNPKKTGTKVSPHYKIDIEAGGNKSVCLRLNNVAPSKLKDAYASEAGNPFGKHFNEVFGERLNEADEFYRDITPPGLGKDGALVMRQAMSGMLWSKQYYSFDLERWLKEHDIDTFSHKGRGYRNKEWFHMVNDDIISMPDKWEYPWYAAWDLAFHSVTLSFVDLDFAKQQMGLMLKETYLHPNGQIPAYEWNFSDVNPPVHAWAVMFMYKYEKVVKGKGDVDFLKRCFSKLMLNFTWWVNRKDRFGRNVFEGGFLGLDNIGIFDRSSPLPTGGHLEQADGTAWMALFCQNMFEMAGELATFDNSYEDMVIKFTEHFMWIASAINRPGADSLWDETDGFYYDLLRLPSGESKLLKIRSVVGLLPLCATAIIEKYQREQTPKALETISARLKHSPELMNYIHVTGPGHFGVAERGIQAIVNQDRLRRILEKMLDENEFLGPYGIRALSRYHADHPYIMDVGGKEFRVDYLPGESDSGMFGGNSNWRGPVWMPMNILIIRALHQYYLYYGDTLKVECPTGSGKFMNLYEVSEEIARRLSGIFLRNKDGKRPVFGGNEVFQNDPNWRDCILFYEYFHGDNGCGLGASHQTGWTGLVATLLHLYGHIDSKELLKDGKKYAIFYNKENE